MATQNRYPFYLGGLATGLASSCTHPLDLVKVQMQTHDGKASIVGTLGAILRQRGVLGLFDGLSAAWFRALSYNMVRFEAYASAKRYLEGTNKVESTLGKGVLAGCFAGIVGGVVSNPGDIVLIRMQADSSKPLSDRFLYRNIFQGLFRVAVDEGPAKLFRGLDVTIVRAMITNVGQLASYDVFKNLLLRYRLVDDSPACHLLASLGSGTAVTAVSQPADVVRSRLMASHMERKLSPLAVTKKLVQAEGIASLWKGFVPAWTRHTPQTILTFMFLEQLRGLVDAYRLKKNGT